MPQQQDLHVIFGTGPLGLAVMRELLQRGQQIRMVNRSGQAKVPTPVEVVQADLYDVAQASRAAHGASVIYQCAQPSYTEWPAKFPPLQAAILETAIQTQAKLIVGENLYVYGLVNGPLHEDLPNNPNSRKGQVRATMSEALFEAHRAGKVRVAVARGSDFYGVGVKDSALGETVFGRALHGKSAQVAGKIDLPHSYTYIDDFGKALVILGEHEAALGQIWHVPNAPTLTTREVITMIYGMLEREPKFQVGGKLVLRLMGLFVPQLREVVEMLYEFEHPLVVDDTKFVQAFGNMATPFEEGLRTTLEWYADHEKIARQWVARPA